MVWRAKGLPDEKIGTNMSIKVHHSIIHAFEKDSDKPLGLVTKMTVLLDSELQGVRSLVWGMAALFGKKENSQE
ncbi:hypothetical protein AXG89_07465 [Burkholderia sp. PAMC 26561]|nr:hypothetical protein AXG89_07465 [Burkholderia sp. PAMC 26561]